MQLSELCAEDKHAAEKKEKFWYKQVTLDGFHGTSQKTLFKNICRNAKKNRAIRFLFSGGSFKIHYPMDLTSCICLKHLELKICVLGGPYLSFIKYKGNSFRFWWSVPLFPELWEITYVFGGFTLLLFILYILLFYELTITDKKKYVKKKIDKI